MRFELFELCMQGLEFFNLLIPNFRLRLGANSWGRHHDPLTDWLIFTGFTWWCKHLMIWPQCNGDHNLMILIQFSLFINGLYSFNDMLRLLTVELSISKRFSLNWCVSKASFSWSFCIVCVSFWDAWKLLRAISTALSLLLSNQISSNICWCWILLRFPGPILSRLRKFIGFFFTSA